MTIITALANPNIAFIKLHWQNLVELIARFLVDLCCKLGEAKFKTKIVAAPADATEMNGVWFAADGSEVGPVI